MNYYAKALEIVTDPRVDYKAIVLAVAKQQPSAIVNAVATAMPDMKWQTEVDNFIHDNQKIAAIKCYRANTGVGLKVAKDRVEERMIALGRPV